MKDHTFELRRKIWETYVAPLVLTLHTTHRYYDGKPRVATLDSIFLALLMIKENGLNDTMLSPFEV